MRRFLGACLCALFLASCSRQSGVPAGGERHSWTVPHVLRIADISDPDRLNPFLSTMDLVYDLSSLVYSYLIIANEKGELVGDLATEVPSPANHGISADGLTYTYHLHPNVRFHDGVPLTSADVKFSWQAAINPNNNALHREGYDQVRSIDTPDATTVVVHLKRRYPPFLTEFFAPLQEGGKGILPRHLLKKYTSLNQVTFNSAPVGSGPYKFVRWDRGRQIIFARNDTYFKGRPKLEKIIFSVIPDDNTLLNEVRLHHIDLVVSPPSTLYDRYRALPDVVTELAKWNAQNYFIMNEHRPGLNDLEVRHAITMAIDYDGIISKLQHNVPERAYDVLPPTSFGYVKNPPYEYDPAAANALLDRQGWLRGADGIRAKNGTRLDYTFDIVSGSENQRRLSVQMQAYFAAIGMHLTIKTYPYNTIFAPEGPIYSGNYDFGTYSTTLAWDPDLQFYLGCNKIYPAGENVYRYCNPAVDALEARGLQSDNVAERARAYHEAEPLIWDTVPYVPLYEARRPVVHSPDLKNFVANPTSTPWFTAWQWDI
jgi:peptide/nickel transport system substrate-binding protein